MAFCKLKALLRKAAARTVEGLWAAIGQLIGTITPDECANSFAAAGYEPDQTEISLFGRTHVRGFPYQLETENNPPGQSIPAMAMPRFFGPRRDAPGRYGGGSSRSFGATRRRQSVTRAISASIRARGAPTQ